MKNVKFNKITIQNFKGVSKFETSLTDLTKITGKNGSGKSTIYDAITWLLFNKNSHNAEKFGVRRLLPNGDLEHNTEIVVELEIEVDGNAKVFKKTQKENWVKHRGSENPTLDGNPNSYEIDGFPIPTEKKWKEEIAAIIDEDKFKLLCNPMYFTSMKWKEQREIIMGLVEDVSDIDLVNENSDYEVFRKDVENKHSLDEIRTKYSGQKRLLNQKLKELPARIDELQNQIVEIDIPALKAKKEQLTTELNNKSVNVIGSDVQELIQKRDLMYAKATRTYAEETEKQRQKLEQAYTKRREVEDRLGQAEKSLNNIKERLDALQIKVAQSVEDRKAMGEKYKEVNAKVFEKPEPTFHEEEWVFDESTTICSLCGQKLPADKISELKKSFADKKAAAKKESEDMIMNAEKEFMAWKATTLKNLRDEGTQKKSEEVEDGKQITAMTNDIVTRTDFVNGLKEQLEDINTDINKINEEDIHLKSDEMKAECELLNTQIENTQPKDNTEYKEELQRQIAEIDKQLGIQTANENLQNRIHEIETEQEETAQNASTVEKILYLLDNLMSYKLNKISESVNSHFEGINFKLFNVQVNGGIAETCEVTVDGVPFSDLNSGHRIVAGLQIINALQDHYEVKAPVVIDNAETINDFNIPKMDCQVITLSVSENDLEVKEN